VSPTRPAAAEPFAVSVRVYYQHTDAGGVVYHANYLSFMEAARTELLHRYGFNVAELAGGSAVMFIVHRARLSFRRPARLHDLLSVTAYPGHVGRASISFCQDVLLDAECLVSGVIDLACVDPTTWRPVAVPDLIRDCMFALKRERPSLHELGPPRKWGAAAAAATRLDNKN
jgi:acyl-CoA thioester hydrolase